MLLIYEIMDPDSNPGYSINFFFNANYFFQKLNIWYWLIATIVTPPPWQKYFKLLYVSIPASKL